LIDWRHDGTSCGVWVNTCVYGFGSKFHSQNCFDKINRIL
jgi:hypothetical protein